MSIVSGIVRRSIVSLPLIEIIVTHRPLSMVIRVISKMVKMFRKVTNIYRYIRQLHSLGIQGLVGKVFLELANGEEVHELPLATTTCREEDVVSP